MDEQELKEHFLRFRDLRDADALARVFDHLAPGLLKVARHLTRDRTLAEDLLQATFLTAMEKASSFDTARPLRPWLVGILVLHARQMRRVWSRIPEVEKLDRPCARDPSEIVSSRELEEEVDRALRSLPDRYRQVLVSRFRLGLRGTDIARDTGRSPGVVRMQIHRGLELLKRALPQSLLASLFGFFWSRRALASVRTRVLAGAAAPAAVPQASTLLVGGVIVMKKVILATACTALLLSASILFFRNDVGRDLDPGAAAAALSGESLVASGGATGAPAVDDELERIPVRARPSGPQDASDLAAVRGRVLDPRGLPVAGSRLFFEGKEDEAVESDAQGRFVFPRWYPERDLVAAPPHILVHAGREAEGGGRFLVAAQRVDVNGTVTSENGLPLQDARATVDSVRLVDFPGILEVPGQLVPLPARRMTDAAGRFSLSDLPAGCAVLKLEKEGYQALSVPVDEGFQAGRTFVLHPLASDRIVLTGRVMDHLSRTVPGALVGLGDYRTRTEDWGAFRIEFHREEIPESGATLFAARRGYRSKVIPRFGAGPDALASQVEMDIILDGPALSISGRLRDAAGEPVAGSTVMLWEEEYLAGQATPEDLAAVAEQAAVLDGRPLTVPRDTRAFSITDPEGGFTVGGLDDRTYRFRIFDDEIGFAMTTRPIRAGSRNVEVVIPADAFREKLEGRIVDRFGAPVAGAEIRVSMQRIHTSNNNSWIGVGQARCGDDGRFVIPKVCRLDTILLDASGPGICPLHKWIEPDDQAGEITLVVERLCYFRVELSDPSMAHAFNMLDENGNRLEISERGGIQTFRKTPFPLRDGKTEVVSTSDRACTIRLIGRSQRLLPVRLVPGEVTVLRF